MLAVTGCANEIHGEPSSEGEIAGLPITHFESGLKDEAPTPNLSVTNMSSSQEDQLAVAAIADVSAFWSKQFPLHFGQEFEPVAELLSYDPHEDDMEVCGASTSEAAMNAFYCPAADLVAWDRGMLLPLLRQQFGPMAVVTVLGHEFGHAVQYRLGEQAGINQGTSTIVKEQQADCFTGAYFRWIAEGNSEYFRVSTSEGLNQVMASLFFIRDEPGQSASAQARTNRVRPHIAFQLGFNRTPRGARRSTKPRWTRASPNDLSPPTTPAWATSPSTTTRWPCFETSLDESFAGTGVQGPRIVNDGGSCPPGCLHPTGLLLPGDQHRLHRHGRPGGTGTAHRPGGRVHRTGFRRWARGLRRVRRGRVPVRAGHPSGPGHPDRQPQRGAPHRRVWWARGPRPSKAAAPPCSPPPATSTRRSPNSSSPAASSRPMSTDIPPRTEIARIEALRLGYYDGSPACSQKYP